MNIILRIKAFFRRLYLRLRNDDTVDGVVSIFDKTQTKLNTLSADRYEASAVKREAAMRLDEAADVDFGEAVKADRVARKIHSLLND